MWKELQTVWRILRTGCSTNNKSKSPILGKACGENEKVRT